MKPNRVTPVYLMPPPPLLYIEPLLGRRTYKEGVGVTAITTTAWPNPDTSRKPFHDPLKPRATLGLENRELGKRHVHGLGRQSPS